MRKILLGLVFAVLAVGPSPALADSPPGLQCSLASDGSVLAFVVTSTGAVITLPPQAAAACAQRLSRGNSTVPRVLPRSEVPPLIPDGNTGVAAAAPGLHCAPGSDGSLRAFVVTGIGTQITLPAQAAAACAHLPGVAALGSAGAPGLHCEAASDGSASAFVVTGIGTVITLPPQAAAACAHLPGVAASSGAAVAGLRCEVASDGSFSAFVDTGIGTVITLPPQAAVACAHLPEAFFTSGALADLRDNRFPGVVCCGGRMWVN